MKRLFLLLITGYQRFISPLFPPSCRYYPSCSEYARVAFERHGVLKGGGLACWRIVRCGPWSKGGVDEVPEVECRCGRHHTG